VLTICICVEDQNEFLQSFHAHPGSGGVPAIGDPAELGSGGGIGRIEDEGNAEKAFTTCFIKEDLPTCRGS
jgi:hypothetical protein